MPNPFAEVQGPQPPRTLVTPLEIFATLKPLQLYHAPLTLRFADLDASFQTYLVELDRERGLLALDELVPEEGQQLIRRGLPFVIESAHEGARLDWTNAQPAQLGRLDGVPCYWIPFPSELIYHQRRNAYRASLASQKVIARLTDTQKRLDLQGELLDISANGCKFRVHGDMEQELRTGVIFQRLMAQLSFGDIETQVELRHVTFDGRSDRTLLGLKFFNLRGLLQRQVERYISQLQRETRRNL